MINEQTLRQVITPILKRLQRLETMESPTEYVYALWNRLDKSADLILSNGDRTVTNVGTGAGYPGVRSTIGKSSGKWYWELEFVTNNNSAVGVASSTETLAADAAISNLAGLRVYLGANGNKYSPSTAYGASFAIGDIIGIKLDMDAGTLECLKNNVSQGTLVSGLTGTYYAYAILNVATSRSVIANFGETGFIYSVPAGYNSGLYT